MCILKVYSDKESFATFAEKTNIPVFSKYEKGDISNKTKNLKRTDYRISFDVSDKEWDNLKGQVQDTILFLNKYFEDLQKLLEKPHISSACLDFPIYSRLDEDVVNQNDEFPKELIILAGKLSLGIELSTYSKDIFEL